MRVAYPSTPPSLGRVYSKRDARPTPAMETERDSLDHTTEHGQGKFPDDSCACSWSRDQADQLRQEAGGFQKGGLQGEKWNWFCINAFEHLENNTVGTWWSEWHTRKKNKI